MSHQNSLELSDSSANIRCHNVTKNNEYSPVNIVRENTLNCQLFHSYALS